MKIKHVICSEELTSNRNDEARGRLFDRDIPSEVKKEHLKLPVRLTFSVLFPFKENIRSRFEMLGAID